VSHAPAGMSKAGVRGDGSGLAQDCISLVGFIISDLISKI
jgi:hypothetical protein